MQSLPTSKEVSKGRLPQLFFNEKCSNPRLFLQPLISSWTKRKEDETLVSTAKKLEVEVVSPIAKKQVEDLSLTKQVEVENHFSTIMNAIQKVVLLNVAVSDAISK
ncbi:hypothetical protein MKW92_048355, partial [Papaver armeniacum]